MSNNGIYRFRWNAGRMGRLDSIFVATDDAVADAIGKRVYFGEVLGKHSDVQGILEASDITLVTAEPSAVAVVVGHDLFCGYNPLEYLASDDDDEEEADADVT